MTPPTSANPTRPPTGTNVAGRPAGRSGRAGVGAERACVGETGVVCGGRQWQQDRERAWT